MVKIFIGVVLVSMVGHCAEEDDLGSGMRIQKGA